MKNIHLNKKNVTNIFIFTILGITSAVFLIPIIWTVLTSIKPNNEIYSETIKFLPRSIVAEHYVRLFTKMKDFHLYFFNSANITFWTLILVIVLSTSSGYTFGVLTFRGHKVILAFLLLVLTLPYALYLIPVYIMLDKFSLIDTHIGLILPYAALNLPMSILIMRGNFKTVPREIEEAAVIDGCGFFKTWLIVILPIVKPGISVITVLAFLNVWGEFLYGRTLTNTPNAQTLAIGITFLRDEAASWQFGPLSTAITLSIIPPLILFLAMQKYIISGITEGAVKG